MVQTKFLILCLFEHEAFQGISLMDLDLSQYTLRDNLYTVILNVPLDFWCLKKGSLLVSIPCDARDAYQSFYIQQFN